MILKTTSYTRNVIFIFSLAQIWQKKRYLQQLWSPGRSISKGLTLVNYPNERGGLVSMLFYILLYNFVMQFLNIFLVSDYIVVTL